MRSVLSAAVGVSLMFLTAKAMAWGAKGHQIVSYVGAQVAGENNEPFWASNVEGMRQLSTVPDRVWKSPNTKDGEAPTHWFQADFYVKDLNQCEDILSFPSKYQDAVSKYGEDVVVKNGTAPYRIVQMYNLAVDAFRKGDNATAVEMAGAMSHYIGDLSQPLHVSENYDGNDSGNGGIHAWFETKNINDETAIRGEVLKRARALLQDPSFIAETQGDMSLVIDREIIRSLLKRDEVLGNDSKLGRSSPKAKQVQLDLAEDRMADGAAVLAVILGRLAQDAGLSNKSTSVPIQDPSWIEPEFGTASSKARLGFQMMTSFKPTPFSSREDDCDAE